MTLRPRPRTGFTLIELLIVMGLIVLLAGLAVLFLPNLDRNKGVPNAVTQVQGWINISKQQALRDHSPRGVRLIHDGDGRCTSLVYIEQPDPVAPRGPGLYLELVTPAPNAPTIATLKNSTQAPQETAWDGVQPGDFLEVSGGPFGVAQITA